MKVPVDDSLLSIQESKYNVFITEIEQWKKDLELHKRLAYLPVVEPVKMEFSAHSKIGGIPYLRNENDWPSCPNCERHMDLFVQLNLSDLPNKQTEGIVQLFYCTNDVTDCNSDLNGWETFSKISVVRRIQVDGSSAKFKPNLEKVFQEKRIVSWQAKYDYPSWEEYDKLGIKRPSDDGVFDLLVDREIGVPINKDKLFGWPFWAQEEAYPHDRKTDSKMSLLFQLASMDNLAFNIGDDGIGHLMESLDDANELGFGWANS